MFRDLFRSFTVDCLSEARKLLEGKASTDIASVFSPRSASQGRGEDAVDAESGTNVQSPCGGNTYFAPRRCLPGLPCRNDKKRGA